MTINTPPPNLPVAPKQYEQRYIDQLNNILNLFFRKLTTLGPLRGTNLVLVDCTLASRLTNTISAVATVIPVEHPEYFPERGYGTLNNSEKFYWDGKSGNNLINVLRGQLGTTATNHNLHDVVVPTAETGAIYAHPVDNALFRVF